MSAKNFTLECKLKILLWNVSLLCLLVWECVVSKMCSAVLFGCDRLLALNCVYILNGTSFALFGVSTWYPVCIFSPRNNMAINSTLIQTDIQLYNSWAVICNIVKEGFKISVPIFQPMSIDVKSHAIQLGNVTLFFFTKCFHAKQFSTISDLMMCIIYFVNKWKNLAFYMFFF
jgi:hypothetical protein